MSVCVSRDADFNRTISSFALRRSIAFFCSLTEAPFTRVRTNFCTDEFCSWTASLHGSVQILLQIAVVFTRIRANLGPVVAFEWLYDVSVVIGYRCYFVPIMFAALAMRGKSNMAGDKNFTWTDEEITLLLHVVIAYKTGKAGEGVDWETVRSKYEDLTKMFLEKYPENDGEKFPRRTEATVSFSKDRIQNKLKRIKLNFRKAVDKGRCSGGGRVVTFFYEECCEIWSGAPAVESIACGIDTSSIDLDSPRELEDDSVENLTEDVAVVPKEELESVTDDKVTERRQLLQKQHKGKRDSKLTKKLSTYNPLLAVAREDLQLKRKVLDQMEEADKKHQKTMDSLLRGFTSLTSALNNGFGIVGSLLS